MKYVYIYLITFVVFFVIDLIWLTLISKNFYSTQIGHLMASKPNLVPALIFYLMFVGGIIVLALIPGLEAKSLAKTAYLAAIFGLLSYATYDLTNLATLKDWPLIVTVVDMIWGTFLATTTGVISYLIIQRIDL